MLAKMADVAEEWLAATAFPYESAGVLKSLYHAFAIAGDAERAEGYRLRARALARKNGFFEIVLGDGAGEGSGRWRCRARRRLG